MAYATVMAHWAAQLIGLPWQRGAQGPTSFDCYGFVRHVQRVHYGRELPDYAPVHSSAQAARALAARATVVPHWRETQEAPKDGDVILLGRAVVAVHIGVAVKADGAVGVLHCVENRGVVFQTFSQLTWTGWGLQRSFSFVP